MPVAKKLGKIAGSALLYLIVFDIVGVVGCLLLDILFPWSSSEALFYAVWFVLGVFCGLFSYNTNGSLASPESKDDWTSSPDAAKTGVLVILTTSAILLTLSLLFYRLLWRHGVAPSYFVPDSAPLTLTFFVTILASAILAHTTMRPEPKKHS